ncbi:hypothetical protein JI743_05580 [Sphingopyxis sp. DHUNG17]|uniref:hypothetical protein n=1 Tax=Sphingopyxis jiangsuensis TaxID=2871171 RepID=UPI00191EBC64|nr:hypothetical protein [Sphingopyxis lutea]MBL0768270.1 hypothetical protein [Sphingopyxis lutea]
MRIVLIMTGLAAAMSFSPSFAQSNSQISAVGRTIVTQIPSGFSATNSRNQTRSFYANKILVKGCQFDIATSVDREGPRVTRNMEEHQSRFAARDIASFAWGAAPDGSGWFRLNLTQKLATYGYEMNGRYGETKSTAVRLFLRSKEDADRLLSQFEQIKTLCG